MFIFDKKEYSSKAEVVREMYDAGELTMAPDSKKSVAELLGMTVQTVHATLTKYIKGSTQNKVTKKSPKKVTKKATKKSKGKIRIEIAPNIYGLPIINPPLEVTKKDIVKNPLTQIFP